jgi:hypothetical protein
MGVYQNGVNYPIHTTYLFKNINTQKWKILWQVFISIFHIVLSIILKVIGHNE